jgi:hypothetical protein
MTLRQVLTATVCYTIAAAITCATATAVSLPLHGPAVTAVWIAVAVVVALAAVVVADPLIFPTSKDGAA